MAYKTQKAHSRLEWLKQKLRTWLEIDKLDKRTNDLWWEINDGGGLKAQNIAHEGVLDFIIEMMAQPDKYKWEYQPKTKQWILTHPDGWVGYEWSFYDTLQHRTRYLPNNKNYAFKKEK